MQSRYLTSCIGLAVLLLILAISFKGSGTNKDAENYKRKAVEHIERVLLADQRTGWEPESVSHVVSRMRAVDLEGCPKEFQKAYLDHIYAWNEMSTVYVEMQQFIDENPAWAVALESFMRGLMFDPLGKHNELQGIVESLKRKASSAGENIIETFRVIEKIAIDYGASMPRRIDAAQIQRHPRITRVEAEGVAAVAGIQTGDVLVEYDGLPMEFETATNAALSQAIESSRGKPAVDITLVRMGNFMTLTVPGGQKLGITYNVNR